MPWGALLEEVPLDHLVSPEGAPFEASPAGAFPLQQWDHSRLDVKPVVTRAGVAAARFLL